MLAETADALEAAGIIHPFPIQEQTIPLALGGADLIGQAKTGTGKTLAFGVPLLQRLVAPGDDAPAETAIAPAEIGKPQALVVVPTRELCQQVAEDIKHAGARRGVRVLAIVGGRAYEPQVEALQKGVEVVVGTPGRLIDLANQRKIDLSQVRTAVLDEADEMLDLGFLPDVERIVAMLPTDRQTLLFSATMAGPVLNLARRYMNQPIHIRAHDPEDQGATVKLVKQYAYRAHNLDKVEMLARVLQAEGRGLTLVFCRTKRTAQRVEEELTDRGFAVGSLHGDLGQGARERAMRAFRKGKIDVLVATDVAARGIDVDDITHVVNYQCPDDHSTYVHRIGRTARAGRSGTAITFVDWDELHRWEMIDTTLELGIGQARETYSASPWLYSDLGIPAGAKGVLPRDKRVREGLEGEEVEDLGETGKHTPKAAPPKRHHESRGGRGGGHAAGEGGGTRAARAPRERTRTRTRGGEEAASAAGDVAQPAESAPRAATTAEGGEPAKRRRRRGGRGRGSGGGSGDGAAGQASTTTGVPTDAQP